MRLPARYRPFLFAAMQCLVTTGLSTLIATASGSAGALQPARWLSTWAIAWLALVPFVIAPAPFLEWLLSRVVEQESSWTASDRSEHGRKEGGATPHADP